MSDLQIFPEGTPEPDRPPHQEARPLFPAPTHWRPPHRKSRFGVVVAVLLSLAFMGSLLGFGRWAQQRTSTRQQDEAITREIKGLADIGFEAKDAPKFERAAERIESLKQGASADARAMADGILRSQREQRALAASHQSISEKLAALHVLTPSEIASREDLDTRIERLEALADTCARMHDHGKNLRDLIVSRIREAGGSERLVREFREGFDQGVRQQSAQDKASLRAGLALRLAEKRWAEGAKDALTLLKEQWGRWRTDPTTKVLRIDEDAALERWNQLVVRINQEEIHMQRLEAERLVLDPASQLPILETVVPGFARRDFRTRLVTGPARPDRAAVPAPPPHLFQRTGYAGPLGEMAALATPPPAKGGPRPAVLWVHDGTQGLSRALWDPRAPEGASLRAFIDAGFVVFCPSFRGENLNPGAVEVAYGELDDLLAAIRHVAGLPHVDPERIYLVGAGTGGTLTLLAAATNAGFRAAFALGAPVDVTEATPPVELPFDPRIPKERELRAPATFVSAIARPTLLFKSQLAQDSAGAYTLEARAHVREAMEAASSARSAAREPGARSGVFRLLVLTSVDDNTLRAPMARWIARKIAEDTAETWRPPTEQEAQEALEADLTR